MATRPKRREPFRATATDLGSCRIRGIDDIAEAIAIERFEPKQFIADDETVVVIGDETARVHATARQFATSWVHLWTLRAGKVASLRCFADTAAVAAAFAS